MVVSETSASALDRKTLSIIQNKAAADNAIAVDIVSTGGRKALHIDKNHSATAAASGANAVKGIDLDLDQSASGTNTIDVFGIDINSTASGGTGTGTNVGLRSTVAGTAATKYSALFSGGNTGFGVSTPVAMVDIASSAAQLKLSTGSGGVTVTTSGSTLTLSGPLATSVIAGTGNITTTSDIGANTASITTGAALDVKGAIALSQEIDPSTISAVGDTGFLFANTDGALVYKNQSGTVTNISQAAAGASTTAQNAFSAQQFFDDQALTSAATVSWNANTAQVATLALGHNATVANATNHQSGGVYIMRVTQNTAPKTLAWSTGYKWPGNTAPVMTATGGAGDIFTFVSDGTYMYGSFSGSQNFT